MRRTAPNWERRRPFNASNADISSWIIGPATRGRCSRSVKLGPPHHRICWLGQGPPPGPRTGSPGAWLFVVQAVVRKPVNEFDAVRGTGDEDPRLPLHYIPLAISWSAPCITWPAGRSSFGLRSEIVLR